LIALLASAAAVQAAEAYKWVDANGVMHYSDTAPPPEAQAQLVHLKGTGVTTAPAAIENGSADTEDGKPAAKKAPETLVSSVMSDEKRCAVARANLEALQRSGPVALDTGGKGTPQPLSDNERLRQIAGAQTIIATYCR
jgi:hypothetical protein